MTLKRRLNGDCPDITIRAHHLLCIQGFQGYGYSEEFTENMELVIRKLRSRPSVSVMIVDSADEICTACPFMDGEACMMGDESVKGMDSKLMEILGIRSGDIRDYSELESELKNMEASLIREVCGDCSWIDVCLLHSDREN
ncbi:hypothetical protein HNR54_000689 [Methanothermobacter sp. DSM 3267]